MPKNQAFIDDKNTKYGSICDGINRGNDYQERIKGTETKNGCG